MLQSSLNSACDSLRLEGVPRHPFERGLFLGRKVMIKFGYTMGALAVIASFAHFVFGEALSFQTGVIITYLIHIDMKVNK